MDAQIKKCLKDSPWGAMGGGMVHIFLGGILNRKGIYSDWEKGKKCSGKGRCICKK